MALLLVYRLRRNAVFFIKRFLYLPPPVRFIDGALHGIRQPVCVHHHMTVLVPGRPPDSLHHGRIAAQKTFLVRIQNSNTAHFRQVQAFPQQVDTHQHIKLAFPQCINNLGPFNSSYIGMKIAHPHFVLFQIIRQVLRHPLGQGGHQHTLTPFNGLADLAHQVIDLSFNGTHFHMGIQQAGRPDDLLHHLGRLAQFIIRGSCGNINHLVDSLIEFFKG